MNMGMKLVIRRVSPHMNMLVRSVCSGECDNILEEVIGEEYVQVSVIIYEYVNEMSIFR